VWVNSKLIEVDYYITLYRLNIHLFSFPANLYCAQFVREGAKLIHTK